ncbi:vesicle-associated membrane protein 721 isoform X2 [Tetranychus urticae]|uniref:V-SNARE coiled-coil homology domain-containing protein n=1 Tax=Tetranychus urticae TaxID=32264 RepID=T1KE86_TETUR|nr:vesicle-associated membrane protein 721 isoform X2 [Tetranychus urticae]
MADNSHNKADYQAIDVESSPERDQPFSQPGTSTQPKVDQVQQQVAQVTNMMQENISKILDRGQKLDHLEDRSALLSSKSEDFRVSSRRLGRKMKWQNMRVNIIIGLIVIALIIIIYFAVKH